MKRFSLQGRSLAALAVVIPLVGLLGYVALRSGPLAPVAVTAVSVESRSIQPALFGIGTVEARYTHKIGPTFAGRVNRVAVDVGDRVEAGGVLGEMDPVDLDDRIRAQQAALKRSEAAIREASARQSFALTQAQRYEAMFTARLTSEESVTAKRQERQIADAALAAAREDRSRVLADLQALQTQRANLQLVSPVDGIVILRAADPGTTLVAGQAVVELIDATSLWVDVRFDQISAAGLAAGLPARIVLRSRSGQALSGRVLRVEPLADAITEETLAKIVFDQVPEPLPPLGELTEVTVDLPALLAAAAVPNAALKRNGDQLGVWQIIDGKLRFTPIKLGRADLDGHVQVVEGLKAGDRIVVYSEKALDPKSRIHVVERIPGVAQ